MLSMRTGQGVVALLALLVAGGCTSGPGTRGGDARGEAEAELEAGRPARAAAVLEAKKQRSAEEDLLLGRCRLELADLDAAETAFFDAVGAAKALPVTAGEALLGLGEVALRRGDGWSAAARFSEARKRSATPAQRDAAVVGQARAELLMGRWDDARSYRNQVQGTGVAGLAALDRELGVPEPGPAVRGVPEPPAARPGDRGGGRALQRPLILDRSRWHARRADTRDMDPMGTITRLTVHHTADRDPVHGGSVSRMASQVRSYQGYHMNGRGWSDIGYHFVIDPDGRIWEGRELRWQGAHAGNGPANRHNVGIALIGNFNRDRVTRAQKRALKSLVEWLVVRYHIRPSALHTHREIKARYPGLSATQCPGRDLASYFNVLRRHIRRTEAAEGSPGSAPPLRGAGPGGGAGCACREVPPPPATGPLAGR